MKLIDRLRSCGAICGTIKEFRTFVQTLTVMIAFLKNALSLDENTCYRL